jgi:hypothetical protein
MMNKTKTLITSVVSPPLQRKHLSDFMYERGLSDHLHFPHSAPPDVVLHRSTEQL